MSKRKHDEVTDPADNSSDQPPPIFTSTPIHDRGSIFTAIFSPSTTSPRSFQKHPPFKDAMHKILAWRKISTQRSLAGSFNTSNSTAQGDGGVAKVVYETGSDEDGEKYAGKKVERVLVEMDVAGTVVVARWYGGVLLGPVRFKWIEDAAREAIGKWKATSGEAKRVKVGKVEEMDDSKEKERLVRVLNERDVSVNVLRELLAEKNRDLKKLEVGEEEEVGNGSNVVSEVTTKSPVAAAPNYDSMPLQRLKQLEKARDASLNWILKQIDAVEEKMKVVEKAKG